MPQAEQPAVLFLHGVRASHKIWDAQVAATQAAGYQALAIDLPGHGVNALADRPRRAHSAGDNAGRFSLSAAFDAIDVALQVLNRPTILVGHSLGGYTALAYAATHPDAPLVGIVAAGCATDPKGKPVGAYRGMAAVANAGFHHTAHAWRRLRHTEEPEPGPSWQLVTDALRELAGHSTMADIRQITVPIWFINGSHDHLKLQHKLFAASARDGASVIIPEAGHDVNTDQPDAFNKVMLRALAEFAAR